SSLDRVETRALLTAAADHRFCAAVALLFLQGWRVSDVLGLGWEALDLEAGTARARWASEYVDRAGPATRAAQDRRRARRALADADDCGAAGPAGDSRRPPRTIIVQPLIPRFAGAVR